MASLLFAFGALSASGSTITVTNTNDSGPGSLRAAIASAVSGDVVNFNLKYPATIVVSSSLSPGNGVTISGPGDYNLSINGADGVTVFYVAGENVVISGLTIEHGSAVAGGGVLNQGSLLLYGDTISNNTVGTQQGAGIFNAGTLTLSYCLVSGNSATSVTEQNLGGGIYNYQGTLTINHSNILTNTVERGDGEGAGIAVRTGTVNVYDSTFSGNTAALGGGISMHDGTVTVERSTFSSNTSNQGGSAVHSRGGSIALTNSTIAYNLGQAAILASSFYTPSTTVLLSNSTVAYNEVIGLSSGFSAYTTVKGSILFGNSDGQGNGTDCGPVENITSEGYNLSSDVSCTSYFTQTGDVIHADNPLDPNGLQDNGGPTHTIALVSNSSATNAIPVSACTDVSGNPITTDQRLVTRPQGSACDIGAFEYFQSQHLVQAVETYQIINAVYALSLPSGSQTGLVSPLQGAVDSLNRGDLSSANGQLAAFINQANARVRSGRLAVTKASPLIDAAADVMASLSGQ